MATERSDKLYFELRKSEQQLDYYLIGIAAALTAYLGQHLEPTQFGLNPATLMLGAVTCFCGAVLAGIARLKNHLAVLNANRQQLYHHEAAGHHTGVAMSATGGFNSETGAILRPEESAVIAPLHQAKAASWRATTEKLANSSDGSAKLRDGLLYIGFALLLVGTVWRTLVR